MNPLTIAAHELSHGALDHHHGARRVTLASNEDSYQITSDLVMNLPLETLSTSRFIEIQFGCLSAGAIGEYALRDRDSATATFFIDSVLTRWQMGRIWTPIAEGDASLCRKLATALAPVQIENVLGETAETVWRFITGMPVTRLAATARRIEKMRVGDEIEIGGLYG